MNLLQNIDIKGGEHKAAIFILLNTLTWNYGLLYLISYVRQFIDVTGLLLGFSTLLLSIFLSIRLFHGFDSSIFRSIVIAEFTIGILTELFLPQKSTLTICVLGFLFGFYTPNILLLMKTHFSIDERGRIGGFILGISLILSILFTYSIPILSTLIILSIWRIIPAFNLPKAMRGHIHKYTEKETYSNWTIISFLLPWFLFLMLDYYSVIVIRSYYSHEEYVRARLVTLISGFISALLGGHIIDLYGRRNALLISLSSLGVSYAILSITPEQTILLRVYNIIDGLTWGILTLLYTLVLMSDISKGRKTEKLYAISIALGVLPNFILYPFIDVIKRTSLTLSFSVASLFIFSAIVPLWFAPETLPEEILEERKLRKYITKIRKLKRD